MVKPGGTGKPRFAISARPAPLPPRRLRISARPSAFPLPKLYTHFVSPGDFLRAADRARGAGLRPEAARVDVLFNRLRRDDTAMEPQLDAPALDDIAARAAQGRRSRAGGGCFTGRSDGCC